MTSTARFLTDFADQAVLIPVAVAVGIVFAASGWRRGVFAWTAAIGFTLGITLLLKLALLACGEYLPGNVLRSPSGHTVASGVIYGGLLAIILGRVSNHARWTLPAAVVCAAVIGASRLALGVHTPAEVCLGGIVGIIGAVTVARLAGPPPPTLRIATVAMPAAVAIVLFHGFHMPAEAAIRQMAFDLWPLSSCR